MAKKQKRPIRTSRKPKKGRGPGLETRELSPETRAKLDKILAADKKA